MPVHSARSPAGRRFVILASAAAVSTYLLIVLGGIVRATGSGLGCPDWPLCNGGALPAFHISAWIEFSHRLAAALTTPLILVTAVLAARNRRPFARLAWVGVALLALQIVLGALSVLWELPPDVVAAHFGNALVILGIQVWLAASAWSLMYAGPVQRPARPPFRADEMAAVLFLFLALVTGVWVSARGAEFACSGWPLCSGVVWPTHALGQIHMLHRSAVLAASAAMLFLVYRSWKHRVESPAAAVGAVLTGSLFFAQGAIGAAGVERGFPPDLLALHIATSSAVWGCLAFTLAMRVLAPEAAPLPEAERPPHGIRDYLALTKPLIVALLLVTTVAGMVVGLGRWPDGRSLLVVILAGALSAGGASAVNQFIDRDRDRMMTRTRNRPIPRGALGPAEALSFGLALCVAGFFLFALAANLLSALLALAGMIYYIGIYSLALKPFTPQNIVIGGGAGAIPPMVGWAAATGRLDVGAFFLFALVFFWTPPHFWALALVRQNEYEEAGIPMLPVVRGERETRKQILLYAVQVVALSLLLPLARLGTWISLAAAAIFGAVLLGYAWRLWKKGGRKNAWGMYRYSSLYLALLFSAMVADTLIRK